MKKTILAITVLSLLFTSSCSKILPASGSGGSWTFKNATNNVALCSASSATLTASNLSTSDLCTVAVRFPGSSLPTSPGTYTVVITTPVNNQVNIYATTNGSDSAYTATGGNQISQTVQVSISNGKMSISGTNIEMMNNSTPSDSSALNLNITQN